MGGERLGEGRELGYFRELASSRVHVCEPFGLVGAEPSG